MAEVPFDVWYAVWSIAAEAELGRADGPNYDSTLDHIYELAKGVLDYLGGDTAVIAAHQSGVPVVLPKPSSSDDTTGATDA